MNTGKHVNVQIIQPSYTPSTKVNMTSHMVMESTSTMNNQDTGRQQGKQCNVQQEMQRSFTQN